MFFKSSKDAATGADWWASARLYQDEGNRRRLVMQGPLAELIVAARSAAPAAQPTLTIEVEPDGVTLSRAEWNMLADRRDFPVFM